METSICTTDLYINLLNTFHTLIYMPSNDNKYIQLLVLAFLILVVGRQVYRRLALRQAYETIGFVEAFFGSPVSCNGSYVYQLEDKVNCVRVRFDVSEICPYTFRRGDYLKLKISLSGQPVRRITYVGDNLETIRDMTARICPGGISE